MSYVVELNASNPAAPAGAQNVHFREDAGHLGTDADPRPVSAFLEPFTGDSGEGGASGLVPPPGAGDSGAGKLLGAGGGFVYPPLTINFQCRDGAAADNAAGRAIAPRKAFLTTCTVLVDSSDASTPLIFQVTLNGTLLFSVAPQIAAGAAAGTVASFALIGSPVAVSAADIFAINITSGSSSWAFTAQLR